MDENLKVRVPDDPSMIVRPKKTLSVETFCLGCEDGARPKIKLRREKEDVLILAMIGDV